MDKEQALKRLHQAVDYLKDKGRVHKDKDIVDELGMNKGNASRALNGNERYFTEGFLKRFAAAYSDYINEEWLLTGVGEMKTPDRNMRPHVHAKVAAGFMSGISEGETGDDMRPAVPFFPDYDFTIEVHGDSMMPDFQEGDLLACRIAKDRMNPPIGKVCVIDALDGAAVKQITRTTDSAIVCHSLNPAFRDYEVEFSSVNQLAEVIGLLRPIG